MSFVVSKSPKSGVGGPKIKMFKDMRPTLCALGVLLCVLRGLRKTDSEVEGLGTKFQGIVAQAC